MNSLQIRQRSYASLIHSKDTYVIPSNIVVNMSKMTIFSFYITYRQTQTIE